jgi:hypothetical protein
MSNSDIPVDDTASTGERLAPNGSELYADWMLRMQRGRGRQAAIAKNLYTWSNYKNWAEKIRGSWEGETAPGDKIGDKKK